MPLISKTLGGLSGGGNFKLGTPTNVFGNITLTKAQAEAERDAYAGANPSWLVEYDADITLNIILIYSESGSQYAEYQSRRDSNWIINSSTIGLKGDTGDSIILEYSVDGSTLWHSTLTTEDNYWRWSVDGGNTWSADNVKFRSEDSLTDAEIKSKYENNANTNAYTDMEKAKLNNIESNATADLTANEIEILYEGLPNTNKFTDTEKSLVSTALQNETLTELSINANILSFVNENGATTEIDLNLYLDDTNLARLVSGTLDGLTGIATFTRDDNTTFTVDMSALLDEVTPYDGLDSISTIVPLSANQGKVLNETKANIAGATFTGEIVTPSIKLSGGNGTQGTLSWNHDEETLDLVNDGAILQLGQETHTNVRNNTASTIPNGTVVMATGTIGASGRITVAPYVEGTAVEYILGITTVDILAGDDGKVTSFGKIRGLNTGAYNEGDVLYPINNGLLTNIKPLSGIINPLAFVVSSHTTMGTIMVRVTSIDKNVQNILGTKTIDETNIGNGKVISYNLTNDNLEYTDISDRGDMFKTVYDPTNINANAFDRANHIGTQTISTVSDLQNSLDGKVAKVTSTDNAIVKFDGEVGEIQDSTILINDNGSMEVTFNDPVGVNAVFKNTDLTSAQTVSFNGDQQSWNLGGSNSLNPARGNVFFIVNTTSGTIPFVIDSNNRIGIGTINPQDANLEIGGNGDGIVLSSPNGTRYKITVDDSGTLITTLV